MTSRDFGFTTLRSAVAYRRNNTLVPPNNVYVTSTNGAAIFSDTLTISTINVSTINGGGGGGGGVNSVTAGTNIAISGSASNPVVNVAISSPLDMNGQPLIDSTGLLTLSSSDITLNANTATGSVTVQGAAASLTAYENNATVESKIGDVIIQSHSNVAITAEENAVGIMAGTNITMSTNDNIAMTAGKDVTISSIGGNMTLNALSTSDSSGSIGIGADNSISIFSRVNQLVLSTGESDILFDAHSDLRQTAGNDITISSTGGNINIVTPSTSIALTQDITLTGNTIINNTLKLDSSLFDNNASSGTAGQVLTAGTGGQVIWNIPAVSNYPYIWQYYKVTAQTLDSNGPPPLPPDGTWISWDGITYEQPGYTGRLTDGGAVYSVPLDGWYQITFVGVLCGAVTGSQGYIPQGGTWGSFAAGLISQFTYGIRYNAAIVPGWQGYLNGYVVEEACGVQNQLVVIKYLNANATILVDNETAVAAPLGNFVAGIGTTLTITYLRP